MKREKLDTKPRLDKSSGKTKKKHGKTSKNGKLDINETKRGKKLSKPTKKELKQVINDDLEDMEEEKRIDGRKLPKKGAGRPFGSQSEGGSRRTSALIRKAAAETGKMPMEIALDAARTGYLPRKGKTRRFLDTDQQIDMLKTCMNYFHPKVNPVFEDDEDNRSPFLKLFTKERIATLTPEELQVFEVLLTRLVTGEQKPLMITQDKVVDADFKEVKSKKKKEKDISELKYEDTL